MKFRVKQGQTIKHDGKCAAGGAVLPADFAPEATVAGWFAGGVLELVPEPPKTPAPVAAPASAPHAVEASEDESDDAAPAPRAPVATPAGHGRWGNRGRR